MAPRGRQRGELVELADASLVAMMSAEGTCGDAWAELFERHRSSVHAAARAVLGDHPECADVVVGVFEELWRAPHRFDPERGTLLAYLRHQARNRSIDVLRAESRRRLRETTDYRRSVGSDVTADAESLAMVCLRASWVHDALARLPEPERRAIELAYMDGMPFAAVAALLEEPEGTVKGRIRRGIRRLRSDAVIGLQSALVIGAGLEPTPSPAVGRGQ